MQVNRTFLYLLGGYVLLVLLITASATLGVRLWVIEVSARIPFGDKLGHLALAGVLSFLLNTALACRKLTLAGVRFGIGSLLAYLAVMIEELTQFWLANRNLDVYDLLCAVIGVYACGVLANWNHRRKSVRQTT